MLRLPEAQGALALTTFEAHPPFTDDPGRCAALFVDWQSCSDSGEELLDPVRGQYKEFFIVANAMLGDERAINVRPWLYRR